MQQVQDMKLLLLASLYVDDKLSFHSHLKLHVCLGQKNTHTKRRVAAKSKRMLKAEPERWEDTRERRLAAKKAG